ncbi:alpha/beta hydrolase family protein [Mycolicibacterium austroafricanum]|uniref:alpha/beta hydrolase family protein n=1 Tax=Mycolicibacterium austroafricanum TaxID=39687 RepID=UPI001CA37018|nr:hypothetical protein [Mycolicibacterium austroafricanum]QZT58439.1 hypothetical protein JN084_07550 [Mycolicibacterium austroafricanum]
MAVWFHGQGGTRDNRMNRRWLNALRENGWAIASSDFRLTAWGSPLSVEDTRSLVLWATNLTGVTPTLWIAGSMGSATSLNALNHSDVPRPRCWYGTMPVVDLQSVSNVPGADEQIKIAWNGSVPPAWNPVLNIAALPRDILYRVVTSRGDTQVPAIANGERLVAELQANGATATLYQAVGEHGDDSHFNSTDLQSFAERC